MNVVSHSGGANHGCLAPHTCLGEHVVGEAAHLMEDRKWRMEEIPRKDRACRDMAPLACFLYSSPTVIIPYKI